MFIVFDTVENKQATPKRYSRIGALRVRKNMNDRECTTRYVVRWSDEQAHNK